MNDTNQFLHSDILRPNVNPILRQPFWLMLQRTKAFFNFVFPIMMLVRVQRIEEENERGIL